MKFHVTRMQHLAEVAPDMVTKLEEGSYVVEVAGDQKVNDVMSEVRALTKEWAEENGYHPDGKACQQYLGMVRSYPDRFFLDGFKLPKGWVTS